MVLASAIVNLTLCAASAVGRGVTLSGHSAGGSMAIQHLFAFSSAVDGAAVAAGSAYGCYKIENYEDDCYYGNISEAQLDTLTTYVAERHAAGLIDDPANLRSIPMLLFVGLKDTVVYPDAMRDVKRQLSYYVEDAKVTAVFNTSAAHVWSLDTGSCGCGECGREDYGYATDSGGDEALGSSEYNYDYSHDYSYDYNYDYDYGYTSSEDYSWPGSGGDGEASCCDVNNCGYALSRDIFTRLHNARAGRADATSSLRRVRQWPYVPSAAGESHASLLEHGYLYLPAACEEDLEKCPIHVHYHGCMQSRAKLRKEWSSVIELNEYGKFDASPTAFD
eukprot:gene4245-5228_t